MDDQTDKTDNVAGNNMEEISYASSNHLKSMAPMQYKRQKENEFCDFVLKSVDGKEIKVHKIILASSSPHFADIFDSGLKEATSNVALVPFNAYILESCIEYMYTGNITMKRKDLKDITVIAQAFRLEYLLEFCQEALSQTIEASNCVELWRFSEEPLLEILRENSVMYILRSASILFDDPLFLHLTIDEVKILLGSENLNCSEEKAFHFLVKWIKANEQIVFENGESTFTELIGLIRYATMEESFIATEILSNELFTKNISFWKTIGNHIRFKWRPENSLILKFSKDITPRIGTRTPTLVCLFANSMHNISNSFAFSATKLGKKKRKNFGYTMFRNFLLISGGEQDEFFSPIVDKWYGFPEMKEERCLHSSICVNDKIYVCGGQTCLKNTKSVEVFDLNSGQWFLGPKFNQERANFGLTVLDECLYAFGGETNCVERLDPRTQAWETICNTCPFTEDAKCIVVNDYIYCLNKSQKFLFDKRTNKCGNITNSPVKLFGNSFDICNMSGNTYALGYSECETEIQCHRLNFEENSSRCIWKINNSLFNLASNMEQKNADVLIKSNATSDLNNSNKSQCFGQPSVLEKTSTKQPYPFGTVSDLNKVNQSQLFGKPSPGNSTIFTPVSPTFNVKKSKAYNSTDNLALVSIHLK